jgi:HK97 family phage major capsid protein
MKTTQQLRDERSTLIERFKTLNEKADTADGLTADEKAERAALPAKVGTLDEEIKARQAFEGLVAPPAAPPPVVPAPQVRAGEVPPPPPRPELAQRAGRLRAFENSPDGRAEAYRCGQWLAATLYRHAPAAQWCGENGIEMRALSTVSNPGGGFLSIPEFERAIIKLREEYGTARRVCRVYPMGSDTSQAPRRTGGVTAYFTADNAELTSSDPAWNAVTLTARKLGVLTKYSAELAADAVVSMADIIADEIAYAFAVKEDQCLFLGTGASTYGGIVGLIAAVGSAGKVTAATGHTAFSTLTMADFEGMVGKLPQFAGIQPRWFMHKAGYYAGAQRLMDAVGGVTLTEIAGGGPKTMFLGYPVEWVQCMNSTLTAQTSTDGLAFFGDCRLGVTLGDRGGIQIAVSDQRYFELDQLAMRGVERFDIVCHDVGDSSNAGAVVMLSTPGS